MFRLAPNSSSWQDCGAPQAAGKSCVEHGERGKKAPHNRKPELEVWESSTERGRGSHAAVERGEMQAVPVGSTCVTGAQATVGIH